MVSFFGVRAAWLRGDDGGGCPDPTGACDSSRRAARVTGFFRGSVGPGHTHSSCGREGKTHMLYAILCYDDEDAVGAWTKEEDDAAIAKLNVVQDKWARQGRLGPVARLMPTTAATTLRKGREAVIMDGPFAETKEQLLGFFIVDCASLEDALQAARELGRARRRTGAYEVPPLSLLRPRGAR